MRGLLRYLCVITAMLMVVVGDVWGADCVILSDNGPYEIMKYEFPVYKSITKTFTISDPLPCGNLSFTYSEGTAATGGVTVTAVYLDGSSEEIITWNDASSQSYNFNRQIVKSLSFKGTGTVKKSISKVTLTSSTYADQPSATSWTADTKIIGSPAETTTITMAWSNTSAFTCEITGDGKDRFSAEITEGNASTCSYGTAKILVKYKHDVLGTHNASLKISNGTYTYNISLSGTTLDKYTATFNWLLQDSYYVGDEKSLLDEVYSLVDKDGNNIKNQFHSSIQFSSSDPNVVAIENGKLVAKNAGEAKITAYFPGTNEWFGFTKEINLTIKKRPTSFNLIALSSCYTGEEFALSSLFSAATNNPEVALEYIFGDESILKVEDGKLKAVCVGTTTFTVRQQENYKWLGHSQTLTITVNKYNSNFNLLQTQYTRKIGEVITEAQLYTHSNTDILPTVVSDNPAVVSFNASTRQLEAKTAGQAIITISQPEDCKWTHYNKSCTVTVQKHTPVFIWKDPVYFNQTKIEDYFSTSNKDTKISITNQTDRDVADLYFSTTNPSDLHTLDLTTYNKEASTKVTVAQEENWYWYAKSEEHTITPIDPNNHVKFTLSQENYIRDFQYSYDDPFAGSNGPHWDGGIRFGDDGIGLRDGGYNWDDKYIIIKFRGVPDSIYFSTSTSGAATTGQISGGQYFYVVAGETPDNWSETVLDSEQKENTVAYKFKNNNIRYLKLCYTGNLYGYFKGAHGYAGLTVTELEEFHAVDNDDNEVEYLNFGHDNQVSTNKTLSFNLKYANAGYKVKIESSDPTRFMVNPSTINTIGGCKFGKETILVTYSSKDPYTTTGKENYIVVSDELAELKGHRDTVFLTASSDKADQTLKWQDKYQAVEIPNVRITEERILKAAESTSKLTVRYESSDPTVIQVVEDTILVLKKVGVAVITARQDGNEMWHAADSITKTFRVTDKILQHIAWNDDLTDLELGDADVPLTAKVYIHDDETGEFIYSEERTQLLQYSVEDVSIASIKDKVNLQINGAGETTAKVEVAGDENYEEASVTTPVFVRTASGGCDDRLLLNYKEIKFFQMNLNEIVQGPFTLNREHGVPGTLTFQHYGDFWTLLGVKYYAGSIRPEYTTTDDPDNWKELPSLTPVRGQVYTTRMELPRDAYKIRFVRPYGGEGYHYLQNIQVHPAQYIEAVETIDCGERFVGSKTDTAFVVNFCNIKDAVRVSKSSNDVAVTPVSFGECGGYGNQNISVTWIPTKVDDNAVETITLKDNVSGMVRVVELRAKVSKGKQNISMLHPGVLSDCEYIFPTLTTADLPITWTVVNGNEFAHFEGNKLILDRTGEVTINGSNLGTENYHSVSINYTFTINYDPIFLGTVGDKDWKNIDNWNICRLPDENDIVTIKAEVELDTTVVVKGLKFADAGTIHIADSVGMTIGSYGLELTSDGLITIDNTPTGAGFLKVDPSATHNKPSGKVTINYTTAAYNSGNSRDEIWQYMGAPGEEMEMSDVDKTLIYYWSEQKGWLKQTQGTTLTPFYGYAFTQNKGTAENHEATFEIKAKPIISDKTVDLTCTPSGMRGGNVFVNSYLAPIDVANIDPENDLEGVDGAFYLFKSGSWTQWQNQGGSTNTMSGDGTSPGQYYAITPGAAAMIDANEDQTTIPPMQGAYVVASKDDAKIKLDYKKHVYGAAASNRPMRAPEMRYENFKRVRLQVNSNNSGSDRMYVIQHEDATKGYDYGYDAKNILAEDQVNIYTSEQGGQMEISVSNRIDSTYIGFQAGNDTEYSLRITSVVGEKLYLKDLENETLIALMDGEEYVFQAAPKSVNNKRFLLIDKLAGADDEEVKVYIYDNVVHVLDAPKDSDMVVYTVGGLMVARYTIWEIPCTVELSGLPNGVYVVRIANKSYKFVCK